jgi:hypothetical protein
MGPGPAIRAVEKPMFIRTILISVALLAAPAAAQTAAADSTGTRLAMARDVTARMLPPGAMKTMMGALLDNLPAQMMNQMMDQRLNDFAGMAGTDAAALKSKLGQATIRQLIAVTDPAFEERMRRMMTVMSKGLVDVIVEMEPQMREAMAQAYAQRLTPEELAAAHGFYTTALGASVAAKSLTLVSDPAYMRQAQEMNSVMLKRMPAIMADVAKATADLPKPRKFEDLPKAEQEKFRQLIAATN